MSGALWFRRPVVRVAPGGVNAPWASAWIILAQNGISARELQVNRLGFGFSFQTSRSGLSGVLGLE